MAMEAVVRESRSSIELSRDARGVCRWTLKLYFDDPTEEAQIIQRLNWIDEQMRRQFQPNGLTEPSKGDPGRPEL